MSLFLTTFLFACFDKSQEDTASDTSDPSDSSSFSFEGLSYVLTDSEGYTPVAQRISLSFSSNEEFSFSGACNSFGGEFETDDDTFVVNSLYGTEIGCSEDLAAEDDWLVSFFTSSPTYTLQDDAIIFQNDTATLTFSDRESTIPDARLVDTVWLIDTYTDGPVAQAFNLDATPSVSFLGDGSIDLNTGCNSGMGQYSVDGDSITVNMDAYSDAICEDELLNGAEAHIVSVFTGPTVTFSITENRLTLDNPDNGKGLGAGAQ